MASLQEGDTVETWAMVKHGYVELRFYSDSPTEEADFTQPIAPVYFIVSGGGARRKSG